MPLIDAAYATAASLAAPVLRRMLRRRVARGKEIADRLPERWGEDGSPRPSGRLIWLHGASVGEAVSLLPVLPLLTPAAHVLLTTGTVTSAQVLARRLPALGLQDRVTHRFVPLDVPAWVARFLDHWRPDAAAFVESEIWPNMLSALPARGVPTLLLNARLSAGSAAGWARASGFARRNFGVFERVLAQSRDDAARLTALGARNVVVAGNLKFAAGPLPVADGAADALRRAIGFRPVWLAASTHAGEEAIVASVHARLAAEFPGLLTIVVPRHPDRGASVAAEIGAARGQAPSDGGLWVVDTIGELGMFYTVVKIAFVGGSLVAHGGQNPLEAARLGCAVAMGPHCENFAEPVRVLEQAGALARVADAETLTEWVAMLLRDPSLCDTMGTKGVAAASADAGLPQIVADALLALLA